MLSPVIFQKLKSVIYGEVNPELKTAGPTAARKERRRMRTNGKMHYTPTHNSNCQKNVNTNVPFLFV